jgi:hypothetical protein
MVRGCDGGTGKQGAGERENERRRDDVWMQVRSTDDVKSDRDYKKGRQ